MRSMIVGAAVIVLVGTMSADVLAQRRRPERATGARDYAARTRQTADARIEEVRAAAQAYVTAYNAHNAEAVAGLFAPDAQIVDQDGHAVQGRTAIEQVFAEVFRTHPQARTSVAIHEVRFLNPGLAVEEGTAKVVLDPAEPPESNRYSVVHVRQDGRWLVASARDLPNDNAPASEHLEQLGWLIGSWVDESPDSLVVTQYRWDDDKNFIVADFTVRISGQPTLRGTQRIGWDPLEKVVRSWIFDSEGGFAQGVYSRDGDRWIIKMTGVTRDGQAASSTNVITRADRERMTWESRDRIVGGESRPDVGPVVAVRSPPRPM